MDFGSLKKVRVLQSKINNKNNNSTKTIKPTYFVLPTNPFSAVLLHCLIEKIIVVNNGKTIFYYLREVIGSFL